MTTRAPQERLPGFPRPAGLDEARRTLDAVSGPLYGPERPKGDYSALRRAERRRHFDEGRGRIQP